MQFEVRTPQRWMEMPCIAFYCPVKKKKKTWPRWNDAMHIECTWISTCINARTEVEARERIWIYIEMITSRQSERVPASERDGSGRERTSDARRKRRISRYFYPISGFSFEFQADSGRARYCIGSWQAGFGIPDGFNQYVRITISQSDFLLRQRRDITFYML